MNRNTAIKDKPIVLLSIDKKWADEILTGHKVYEYRRQSPSLEPPYIVLLYATSDTSAIVGTFKTQNVIEDSINNLIKQTIKYTPHKSEEIQLYFEGKETGSAIQVNSFIKYDDPVTLEKLQSIDEEFSVPQNFRYLRPEKDKKLIQELPYNGVPIF